MPTVWKFALNQLFYVATSVRHIILITLATIGSKSVPRLNLWQLSESSYLLDSGCQSELERWEVWARQVNKRYQSLKAPFSRSHTLGQLDSEGAVMLWTRCCERWESEFVRRRDIDIHQAQSKLAIFYTRDARNGDFCQVVQYCGMQTSIASQLKWFGSCETRHGQKQAKPKVKFSPNFGLPLGT